MAEQTHPFFYSTSQTLDAVSKCTNKCAEMLEEITELLEKQNEDKYYEFYRQICVLVEEMIIIQHDVSCISILSLGNGEAPRWDVVKYNHMTDFFNKHLPATLLEIKKGIDNADEGLIKTIENLEKTLEKVKGSLEKVEKYSNTL